MQYRNFFSYWIPLAYPLFKQCVASISSCCLLSFFLTNRLKATFEVLFLLVKTFSPPLHVFSNLEGPIRFEKVKNYKIGTCIIYGHIGHLTQYLLSCLAFGLFLFFFAFFWFFTACCSRTTCWVVILSSICVSWGRHVCLFLTVPVKILLGLRVVVILKGDEQQCTLSKQYNILWLTPTWQKAKWVSQGGCELLTCVFGS